MGLFLFTVMEIADRRVVFWKHQNRLDAVSRSRRLRWIGPTLNEQAKA
jgi:hypothetical protein